MEDGFSVRRQGKLSRGGDVSRRTHTLDWYGEREVEIFRDVGGQLLFERAYGPFSEWHHWRPAAFARQLSFDEAARRFTITTSNPNEVARAFATAFQCLWQTMQLFNTRFHCDMGRDLQRLKKEQLALQR